VKNLISGVHVQYRN